MSTEETFISVKGRQVAVPTIIADNFTIVLTGRWLKTASIKSEEFVERDPSAEPERLIGQLQRHPAAIDVVTFAQRVPDTLPRHSYPMRWDNVAALPILGYAEWWEKRLNQDTRRCVRIAAKRGLEVRRAVFDDALVEGIRGIYDESPVRQGREFWHYGKAFATVKQENGTYADRSEFLGAYVGDELVGFLKMVYVGKCASIMQILSKMSHYDRKPMNALMAKAVEICNERHVSYLFYRKYVYHKGLPDSLTEFKRRNGFEQVNIPRYHVPLSGKGRAAVALGLHNGLVELLPRGVFSFAREVRGRLHERRQNRGSARPGKT